MQWPPSTFIQNQSPLNAAEEAFKVTSVTDGMKSDTEQLKTSLDIAGRPSIRAGVKHNLQVVHLFKFYCRKFFGYNTYNFLCSTR